MSKPIQFLFILISLSFSISAEEYEVDLFCQDMNVVLQKIAVYESNIANANTTRSSLGGAYQERFIKECREGKCVIGAHENAVKLRYEPDHPDARVDGYVAYPDIDVMEQMNKLIRAQEVFDIILNHSPYHSQKEFLIGNTFNKCFQKYAAFRNRFNYQSFLGR